MTLNGQKLTELHITSVSVEAQIESTRNKVITHVKTSFKDLSAYDVMGVTQKLLKVDVLSELANVAFWQKLPPNPTRSVELKYPQHLN